MHPLELGERHAKVWGEELWIANTPRYGGKILRMFGAMRTSIHYHVLKDECIHVDKGTLIVQFFSSESPYPLSEETVVPEGYTVWIPSGTVHRLATLLPLRLVEVSTHHDEADTTRIELGGQIGEEECTRLRLLSERTRRVRD